MFRLAVERINADPTVLPRSQLVAQAERVGREDSFHADKKGEFERRRNIYSAQLFKRRPLTCEGRHLGHRAPTLA